MQDPLTPFYSKLVAKYQTVNSYRYDPIHGPIKCCHSQGDGDNILTF